MCRRIKLSRAKGFKLSDVSGNYKIVSRPSVFGNPFDVETYGRHRAVQAYEDLLIKSHKPARVLSSLGYSSQSAGFADQCEFLKQWRKTARRRLPELVGKNLSCWCPLDKPCHADVLLQFARGEVTV